MHNIVFPFCRKAGGDPTEIFSKYVSKEEAGQIESWKKQESAPMKVVKAMVRTKSGRLIEKTILMTEEEYKAFQETGDVNILKRYMDVGADDVIESWEKASTVYSASDDEAIGKGIEKEIVEYKCIIVMLIIITDGKKI